MKTNRLRARMQMAILLLAMAFPAAPSTALSQDTLAANLSGVDTNNLSLSGSTLFFVPNLSDPLGPLYTVSFEITINGNDVLFTTGRVFGGGTAWAFDLGPASQEDETTLFSGATDMTASQIHDMLDGATSFELVDEINQSDHLQGNILPIPEPQTWVLLLIGPVLLALRRQK